MKNNQTILNKNQIGFRFLSIHKKRHNYKNKLKIAKNKEFYQVN